MFAPLTASHNPQTGEARKVGIICSKAGLDEVYPSLILANGARQAGIEAFIFFTFYGLDAITERIPPPKGDANAPLKAVNPRPARLGTRLRPHQRKH